MMRLDKIYLGDSYRLWGVRVFPKDSAPFEIENVSAKGKRMSNQAFLVYVRNLIEGVV